MIPPWQQLDATAEELRAMQPDIRGNVHSLAVVEGVLQLGEGSEIRPGTVIEGHVRIGK